MSGGVLKHLQSMPSDAAGARAQEARNHPAADPSVAIPGWYLQRWHFHPQGYLSDGGIAWYDRIIRPIYTSLREAAVHEAIADRLGRMGARDILDLGCGPGRLLKHLGDALPDARLTGIDLSPHMVARARQRAGDRAAIRHANGERLPDPAASYDAVVAAHVLGHVPVDAQATLLDEIRRVLRPGGVLIAVEHRWHGSPAPGWKDVTSGRVAGGLIHLIVLRPPA